MSEDPPKESQLTAEAKAVTADEINQTLSNVGVNDEGTGAIKEKAVKVEERRSSQRYALKAPCFVKIEGIKHILSGQTEDISMSGLSVVIESRLPNGARGMVRVDVVVKGKQERLLFRGTVTNSIMSAGRWRHGFVFQDSSDDASFGTLNLYFKGLDKARKS